jgi:hypothetical protein
MAEKKTANMKTTTADTTTSDAPKKPSLEAYLQITREGNPDGTTEESFWIGNVALTNATVPVYAKSEAEVQARAKELLAAHGIEV